MRRTTFALTALALAGLLAVPAVAKIVTSKDATSLAGAMAKKKLLRNGKWISVPPRGKYAGHSDEKIAKFPRKGSHFMVLSTGNVKDVEKKNNSEMTSTSNRGPALRGTKDLVMLRVKFRVPEGKNCLQFDFKFLSEEFPEFVDSDFNDAFIAEMGRTTWNSDRDDPIVESPRNFAIDSNGNPIRVNTVGNARVKRKFARGTTYDAATRTLRASTSVKPGKRKMFLSIFDQGDRQYDSTVFVDGLRFKDNDNCRSGVVVAR